MYILENYFNVCFVSCHIKRVNIHTFAIDETRHVGINTAVQSICLLGGLEALVTIIPVGITAGETEKYLNCSNTLIFFGFLEWNQKVAQQPNMVTSVRPTKACGKV